MKRGRIVIAGGSGFIGSALAAELYQQYGEVMVLTRTPHLRNDGITEVPWSGAHVGEWIKFLDGAEAVINLTGKNIKCLHTPENVHHLLESRVQSVNAMALALEHVKTPPRVWVQAGAVGYYGNSKDRVCTESSPNGTDTLADICRQWEYAFNRAPALKTRKVLLRVGFVLGRKGGALPILARATKLFLGGQAGNGRQFISWVHIRDLARMFSEAITRNDWSGTYNAVAPNPVTNAEFMRQLRRTLHRPWSPPAPAFAVKLGSRLLKTDPCLALDGSQVIPKRLMEAGFEFRFPALDGALREIFQAAAKPSR
jgi:uncharacterized protein (TIGR01777 family)